MAALHVACIVVEELTKIDPAISVIVGIQNTPIQHGNASLTGLERNNGAAGRKRSGASRHIWPRLDAAGKRLIQTEQQQGTLWTAQRLDVTMLQTTNPGLLRAHGILGPRFVISKSRPLRTRPMLPSPLKQRRSKPT